MPVTRANATLTSSTVFSFDLTTNSGGVVESNGFLFGTLTSTSLSYGGAIYKVSVDGGAPQIIYQLNGDKDQDGYVPAAGLLVGSDGYLYGSTKYGARRTVFNLQDGAGTLFRVKQDGTGFQTLHRFDSNTALTTDNLLSNADGMYPSFPLVQDSASGYLYGVTSSGGSNGTGVVFRICPGGVELDCGANVSFEVLYNFSGLDQWFNNDSGAYPSGSLLLVEKEGTKWLYGVTRTGGKYSVIKKDLVNLVDIQRTGSGVIYKIRADKFEAVGSNPHDFQVVHDFSELCVPFIVVENNECTGKGSVGSVGATPVQALLRLPSGDLVGITTVGADNGLGSIYKFNPNSTLPIPSSLHPFDLVTGYAPVGNLTQNLVDNHLKLFGIYASSASVFSLDLDANPYAHQIESLSDSLLVVSANSGLLLSNDSKSLFGTTGAGGGCLYGSVYRLSFVGSEATQYTNCTVYTSSSTGGGGAMNKDWLWALLGLAVLAAAKRRVFGVN